MRTSPALAPAISEATHFATVAREKGRGLQSIPIRFGLMNAVVCACAFGLARHLSTQPVATLGPGGTLLLVLTILSPAVVTYLAATKLAGMINALRRSTLAIIEGGADAPVDIDCPCEIGGLADGFRAMVARLNSNVLRMNVLAYTDSVTGLPNRTVINHLLELAGTSAGGTCAGSLFFLDLDRFKQVNDRFGHEVGDELLRQLSRRVVEEGFGIAWEQLERGTDHFGELCPTCPQALVFARFAGDEFVAWLPGRHPAAQLRARSEAILACLARPFVLGGQDVAITASIGVASDEGGLKDPQDLLVHADIAMHQAKDKGRGCAILFDQALKSRLLERTALESDLRAAIDNGELGLAYQPKVCARTLALRGVEALCRWTHPTRGAIPPDRFIPIAEQSGAMIALGRRVLDLAVAQAGVWSTAGRAVPIAVNVSAVQFEDPDFEKGLLGLLERARLDPALIELEVTETVALADQGLTKQRLDRLRREGIRVAIDDFGTGYSNLSQLARLNVDTLKIDRSLVAGIDNNRRRESMLAATLSMAQALGYKVVAEGVETLHQVHVLAQLGCDELQGFHIARPMSAADLVSWRDHRAADAVGSLQAALAEGLSR